MIIGFIRRVLTGVGLSADVTAMAIPVASLMVLRVADHCVASYPTVESSNG